MNRMTIIAAAIVLVSVAALGAVRPQQADSRPTEGIAPFLPVQPRVGQDIQFRPGEPRCSVLEVKREWVRCGAVPEWRNLYNGATYSVLDRVR